MRILRISDGVDPMAEWFVAEGADAPTMHPSIPVRKAMDDAMIVLYQNGEALNPSNFRMC
jgi:sulfane dehydrogenase subunit SoxC